MTNDKWLDNGASISIDSETYMLKSMALTNTGVLELANLIVSPPVLPSLFTTPQEWISNIIYYPFTFTTDEPKSLQLGPLDTHITTFELSTVFQWFNLGEWYCEPYFYNFADYNGYTKIQIFLPFYGFVDVSPNDVIGKYVQFRLKVDIKTGLGVYYIGVSNTHLEVEVDKLPYVSVNDTNTRIIGMYSTQIGYQIPIGSSNTADVYRNIIGGAIKAAGSIVSSYALSNLNSGSSWTTKTVHTQRNPQTNRQITSSTKTTTSTYEGSEYQKGKAITEVFDYATSSLNFMHTSVTMDKPNNPITLTNAPKSIKIVRYLPKINETTDEFYHLYGKPLGETMYIRDILGYTELSRVHFESSKFGNCTLEEYNMIEDIFSKGVLLQNAVYFTYNNKRIPFFKGETWEGWIGSVYNTYGFKIQNVYYQDRYQDLVVLKETENGLIVLGRNLANGVTLTQRADDEIIEKQDYISSEIILN